MLFYARGLFPPNFSQSPLVRTILSIGFFLFFVSSVNANPLERSTEIQTKTNKAAARSQVKVDRLSEETARLLSEYREVLRQGDSLQTYNDQLDRLLRSQENEMDSLKAQLREIEVTHREIVPLILRMVGSLDQFVSLDRPFLRKERRARVAELRKLLDRADVSNAEKYRRVMEAYQIETEYGRTIESYEGSLGESGEGKTVRFLRIGRVVLVYLTLDGEEAGYWDQGKNRWVVLPDGDRFAVMLGIRIARKEIPADLISLPIAAPEAAQ
ncbi:MAG: DUF3450 domain-containing protein [Nitrospiria bacterium]